nr:putative ribonuclease H-like domain-containing protein [Tanacetum cinerariifolium]
GKSKVHTASVSTASTQVSTDRTEVVAASISHDTVCAYIASQSNGSQIKYEDITQIDEYDIEEIDIKWNMALMSMRANRFWKKTGKKITIQGSDVVGFDKSKGPKEEEQAPKALMAIDRIGWDWSYMANEEENHALVADEEVPTEFALMDKSSLSSENEDIMLYPPLAQVYSPPKKDMSWTGLPEFADDTVTDYSRPSPSIDSSKSNTSDLQNSNSSISEHGESSESIMSKPMIKFVKAVDSPKVVKTNKTETARKSPGNSQNNIDDKGYWDSGCSRHMTGIISYLSKYEPYDAGYVSFGQGGDKITCKENLKDLKVKIIRFDNKGEFKNKEMNEFCAKQWIKREFSNARTPQQNGVAERRNRTLIEAARTML